MNTRISNRVNMINANITYCDENTAATAGIASFAALLTSIKAKMVLVNSLNQIAEGTTKGVTLDTKALRSEMTALAMKCANATLAYANSVGNNTLAAQVNYQESALNAMKKEEMDDVCQTIHNATDANIANVTNYGVAASDVTDLDAAIGLFRTASQNPRQAIISRSQAKRQVDEMVREVIDDMLINQLDKMANTLKSTDANFVNGYKQSREIIDLGSTSARVRGTVLDIYDVPQSETTFRIYKTGTTELVAEAIADIKGQYSASKLKGGDYDFMWAKNGYITVTEVNVHIASGKELTRNIVLQKTAGDAIREGDVGASMVVNIDLSGIEGTAQTEVIVEVSGSGLRFYGASDPDAGAEDVFLEVGAGMTITKTADEFMTETGVSGVKNFLNAQNTGAVTGHYKVRFTHLTSS